MTDWWIPRSADELEAAVASDAVTESHHLECKQFSESDDGAPRVPGATAAKAIASLAVDGGAFILGVAEDKPNRRLLCDPKPLAGLRDSVDQIVANRITPSLRVTINELTRDDGTGYLVVLVPTSPRTPHMEGAVYYGRNERSARRLADHEVRALITRHLDRRTDVLALLQYEVDRDPTPPSIRTHARLFVVAQPVTADPRLLLDAVPNRDLRAWLYSLRSARVFREDRRYVPTLAHARERHNRPHGVAQSTNMRSDRSVIPVTDSPHPLHNVVDLEVREDGGLRYFYAAASAPMRGVEYLALEAIVGEIAGVIELARMIGEQAAFRGGWQFGVALRGMRSVRGYEPDRSPSRPEVWFADDAYDEVTEVDSFVLAEPANPVLDATAGRLVRTMVGPSVDVTSLDPFAAG